MTAYISNRTSSVTAMEKWCKRVQMLSFCLGTRILRALRKVSWIMFALPSSVGHRTREKIARKNTCARRTPSQDNNWYRRIRKGVRAPFDCIHGKWGLNRGYEIKGVYLGHYLSRGPYIIPITAIQGMCTRHHFRDEHAEDFAQFSLAWTLQAKLLYCMQL